MISVVAILGVLPVVVVVVLLSCPLVVPALVLSLGLSPSGSPGVRVPGAPGSLGTRHREFRALSRIIRAPEGD